MGMIPSTNILAKLIGEVWASEIKIKYVSLEEFIVRILTGLRCNRLTTLQSPFSDTELSALISYYRTEAL